MNNCVFLGRFTKDPELRKTESGKSVCSFDIAINDGYGENQNPVFPTIVAWDGKADYICKYGRKGMLVAVRGKLSQRSYEDKQGNKKRIDEYVADYVRVIFEKTKESVQATETQSYSNYSGDSQNYAQDDYMSGYGANETLNIASDDLPF